MTRSSDSSLVLGYDYDKWYGYGAVEPIKTDRDHRNGYNNNHYTIILYSFNEYTKILQ